MRWVGVRRRRGRRGRREDGWRGRLNRRRAGHNGRVGVNAAIGAGQLGCAHQRAGHARACHQAGLRASDRALEVIRQRNWVQRHVAGVGHAVGPRHRIACAHLRSRITQRIGIKANRQLGQLDAGRDDLVVAGVRRRQRHGAGWRGREARNAGGWQRGQRGRAGHHCRVGVDAVRIRCLGLRVAVQRAGGHLTGRQRRAQTDRCAGGAGQAAVVIVQRQVA